jgi:GDPmannose 4,6-dehydratase
MKTAVVTGVTGQDGSHLVEFLLSKNYKVYGIVRRASHLPRPRIDHLHMDDKYKDRFVLVYGDMHDSNSISEIINTVKPDEVYNLAAQSHVKISFEVPEYTADVTAIGPLRVLEAIRQFSPKTKFYQASSSEMFGKVIETPQHELTRFHPRSPYGCAKVFAHQITVNYRESYGIFACCGILFNHESERRGQNFVTKKIVDAVARIAKGSPEKLTLGNMDSRRDWGYAPEYVEAMWLMLQQERPDDYVIATGETHTVREFVEASFQSVGTTILWSGEGMDEVGIDEATGRELVVIDPKFFRPAEVDLLIGDTTKARKQLGWQPKVTFKQLARIMTEDAMKNTIWQPQS